MNENLKLELEFEFFILINSRILRLFNTKTSLYLIPCLENVVIMTYYALRKKKRMSNSFPE